MAYRSLNRPFSDKATEGIVRENETREKTLKACECDHVAHGEALLNREREKGKTRTIRKGRTIEPSFF